MPQGCRDLNGRSKFSSRRLSSWLVMDADPVVPYLDIIWVPTFHEHLWTGAVVEDQR